MLNQTVPQNNKRELFNLVTSVPQIPDHYNWKKSILTDRLPMCTIPVYKKVRYKKGRGNGKNGNDTRKTYAGNKRKG